MSDRDAFRANRDAFKAKHHQQRLENATYTAAEVKVLTEDALRLGRKEASEEIADAILRSLSSIIDPNYPEVLIPRQTAWGLAREVGTRAAPDATSGRTDLEAK